MTDRTAVCCECAIALSATLPKELLAIIGCYYNDRAFLDLSVLAHNFQLVDIGCRNGAGWLDLAIGRNYISNPCLWICDHNVWRIKHEMTRDSMFALITGELDNEYINCSPEIWAIARGLFYDELNKLAQSLRDRHKK